MKKKTIIFFIALLCPYLAFATHVRAGDLTATTVGNDGLTYRFTVNLYRDVGGIPAQPSTIDFGDGTSPVIVDPISLGFPVNAGGTIFETERLLYEVTHTFASAGRYKVSLSEPNRNASINNIQNSSDNIFYIESEFFVNPLLGQNASPILLIPPTDLATIGQRFIHNPGAFDADGDSLSYRLTVSLQDSDLPVQNYRFPDIPAFSNAQENGNTPVIFSINARTGDLIWDAPSLPGEYNIAFFVEEWRDGIRIGLINRDMQILVTDGNNRRPNLIIPQDTCIVAGTRLMQTVRATDPDGNDIVLAASGDLFNALGNTNSAVFQIINNSPPPHLGVFSWQTECADIRLQPYQVIFQAFDLPSRGNTPLVDIQTWQVRVVGPAPENLQAELQPNNTVINLNWDSYTCRNANMMTIWRRRNSFAFEPEACLTGLPSFTGYEQIASVPINENSFTDNDLNLIPGNTYCYRLVATFPFPGQGESYASQESCVLIPGNIPFITNVDVLETDRDTGQIQVLWTPPYFIDSLLFPPPYTYTVLRSEGFMPSSTLENIGFTSDTSIIDIRLNTLEKPYNYQIVLFSQNNLVDTSISASSVRLEGNGSEEKFILDWQANIPWSIATASFPYHYINREINDQFEVIDSTLVTQEGFTYTDFNQGQGFETGQTYHYKITTLGAYGNSHFPEPLINRSQILTIEPLDTIPPCPVMNLSVDSFFNLNCNLLTQSSDFSDPCNLETISNRLTWTGINDQGINCQSNDAAYYKIYRSLRENGELVFIDSVPITQTTYLHNNLTSAAGCYLVRSVDISGNESEDSLRICIDNCVYYELPNTFTPSKDNNSPNNTFIPFRCPRFVKDVDFTVFNQWGQKVYHSTGDIDLNWDGKDDDNNDLQAGVYYYTTNVEFIRLRREDEQQTFRGWINIIR